MEDTRHQSADDLLLGDSGPGKSLDWLALAKAVLKGKTVIMATAILCAAAAAIYVYMLPNIYVASTSILPPQVNRAVSTSAMLSQSGLGGDPTGLASLSSVLQTKSQADVFVAILAAWPIQDQLARRFFPHPARPGQSPESSNRSEEIARVTSILVTKQGMIQIKVADQDPARAAALANGYVAAARDYLRTMALTEASQRRLFYEGQLENTKRDLAAAEVAFRAMQQKSGMVALDTQATTLIASAAALRSQITAKQVQLQSERGYLTANNPQLQITESELAALQGQLAQLESRGQGGLTGRSLSSVPSSELDFVRATRELKYQEGLYDLMLKQYEGARVDEARDSPVIQVVEPAFVPTRKFGPRRLRDIALAFAIGLALGALLNAARYALADIKSNKTFVELRHSLLRWS